MHPDGQRKCLSCEEFFKPDARNRRGQKYCRKAACRKASKAESQRRWLEREGNKEYFACAENTARVQAWRRANPGYAKRRRKLGGDALQDLLNLQPQEDKQVAKQDDGIALQDHWQAQPPVVIGLIAHLTGVALQCLAMYLVWPSVVESAQVGRPGRGHARYSASELSR